MDHLGDDELTALEQFPSEIDGPPPTAWNSVKRRPDPQEPRPKKAARVTHNRPAVDINAGTELHRADDAPPIVFAVAKAKPAAKPARPTRAFDPPDDGSALQPSTKRCIEEHAICALDQPDGPVSSVNAATADRMPPTPGGGGKHAGSWPRAGMVVKVVDASLPNWHNRKCVVLNAGSSKIEVMAVGSSDKRIVRASLLETVVPRLGGRVQLCGGEHEGRFGVLQEVLSSEFCGSILLDSMHEQVTVSVPYEWFSKVEQ